MSKIAFVGFGEVNTPAEIIIKKCSDAEASLRKEGLDLISVFPVTDDYEERDIKKPLQHLSRSLLMHSSYVSQAGYPLMPSLK